MKTANLTREDLAQYILNTAKDSVIDKIKVILSKEEQETVAYTTKGKPLNALQYKAELQKGIEDIKVGNVITDKDLTHAIESW